MRVSRIELPYKSELKCLDEDGTLVLHHVQYLGGKEAWFAARLGPWRVDYRRVHSRRVDVWTMEAEVAELRVAPGQGRLMCVFTHPWPATMSRGGAHPDEHEYEYDYNSEMDIVYHADGAVQARFAVRTQQLGQTRPDSRKQLACRGFLWRNRYRLLAQDDKARDIDALVRTQLRTNDLQTLFDSVCQFAWLERRMDPGGDDVVDVYHGQTTGQRYVYHVESRAAQLPRVRVCHDQVYERDRHQVRFVSERVQVRHGDETGDASTLLVEYECGHRRMEEAYCTDDKDKKMSATDSSSSLHASTGPSPRIHIHTRKRVWDGQGALLFDGTYSNAPQQHHVFCTTTNELTDQRVESMRVRYGLMLPPRGTEPNAYLATQHPVYMAQHSSFVPAALRPQALADREHSYQRQLQRSDRAPRSCGVRPVRWGNVWVATLFAPDDRTVLGVMEDHRSSLATLHDPVVTALQRAWTETATMTELAMAQLLPTVASSQPTCLLATISPLADDGNSFFLFD